jgi:hypothetical protein
VLRRAQGRKEGRRGMKGRKERKGGGLQLVGCGWPFGFHLKLAGLHLFAEGFKERRIECDEENGERKERKKRIERSDVEEGMS